MLLALAQAVANATAALVLKAKNVASQSNDTGAQGKVITAAKETARTTAQLVACVKVVVPSISSHMCQEQVVEAAKLVATAVNDTEGACKVSLGKCRYSLACSLRFWFPYASNVSCGVGSFKRMINSGNEIHLTNTTQL